MKSDTRSQTSRWPVLIETYWNVNDFGLPEYYSVTDVLIETYWNVNAIANIIQMSNGDVLIETYWNVNLICTYSGGKDSES